MILEVAILNVKPGQESAFENAFREAKPIIASMSGFISLELQNCVEEKNRYLLLVKWRGSHRRVSPIFSVPTMEETSSPLLRTVSNRRALWKS